ncbi:hypothetical protein ACFPLB_04375 [Aquamicrobium segne]|uniref:Tip attachment protein J domain-containing protein n=1 Tax=Aquamicrobium segne TaxID=469547 RepID=A0ABW0GWF1_9HYPH
MPDLGASLAFSLIFATGITSGVAVTGLVTAGTLLGYAAPLALALGSQAYSLSKLKKNIALTNDPGGLQQILKQAIPSQRLILGRATTGGALFFYRAKKPYIWYGILLAAHEIDGFENLFINGHTVFIGDDGFATSVPFRDGDRKYIEVSFRNGTLDQQIDPIIARDFPDMPETFRQRGHATIVIKAHYGFGDGFEKQYEDHKRVYGDQGSLQPMVRMRGAKLPDLRKAGVSLSDQGTWVWSDNAALCLGRYLTHKWPDTQILSPDRLNWDLLLRAADECDRWEASKDGSTFRRHTVNGVVQSTDDPWDVIENLKIAMGGHVVLERGKVYPIVRGRREPKATLHQEMLVGGIEYTSEPRQREQVNIVKPTFISADREYQEVAGPVLRRDDLIAQDNKPRETSLRGAFVEDHRRIQRLASAQLNWARDGRTLSCGATLEALSWGVGNVYRIHLLGPLARVNGLYELVSKAWDDRMSGYRLSFVGYVPTATDFDPDDEQDFIIDEDVLTAQAA